MLNVEAVDCLGGVVGVCVELSSVGYVCRFVRIKTIE